MKSRLPILLVPGLNCSSRLWWPQVPYLWRRGPVAMADHTGADTMAGIAARILEHAPPRFVLAGLSMGGYLSFEIWRQAPDRVAGLILLDTSARPDTPEQTEKRLRQIAIAERGQFEAIAEMQFPLLVHPDRLGDAELRQTVTKMAEETGAAAFINQQRAIMGRADSRPTLASINVPSLVVVGEGDALTPPDVAQEIADGIPGASLVVVPGSGHLTTLEKPKQVTDILMNWLAEQPAG